MSLSVEGTEFLLNAGFEVVPGAEGGLELRLLDFGSTLSADPYQIGVLRRFENASTIDAVLHEFPFRREGTAGFLNRCVRLGFLLKKGENGAPQVPRRVHSSSTMFRAPRLDVSAPPAFGFLGVAWDQNTSGLPGARFGPASLRQASEHCRYALDPKTLEPQGFYDYSSGRKLLAGISLADAGDVFIALGEDRSGVYSRITESVRELLDLGAIPLILGGDHSITYPILRAFPQESLGVIHLDAHDDLGGQDMVGLHHGNVFTVVLEKLEFVESIFQVGLRGLYEGSIALDGPNPAVTGIGMDEFRRLGSAKILERIPDNLPYYLSIDIDVMDPVFAPSTGTPVPGGMFPHEIRELVRAVCEERQVVGVDVVEVGQSSGAQDGTAGIGIEVLLTAADGIARGLLARLQKKEDT